MPQPSHAPLGTYPISVRWHHGALRRAVETHGMRRSWRTAAEGWDGLRCRLPTEVCNLRLLNKARGAEPARLSFHFYVRASRTSSRAKDDSGWCAIQISLILHNTRHPTTPSLTNVANLLRGRKSALQIPPLPFSIRFPDSASSWERSKRACVIMQNLASGS